MSADGALAARFVTKRFRADRHRALLRDELARVGDTLRRRGDERRWRYVLRDIDFSIEPGESVALVGTNGSGKSTMLKILAGVMFPYAGRVERHGRVGAMIEVAAGIHPELSGRENVSLYGALLGLDRTTIARRFDDIVAFAGLESSIDRPVKFYSSGMKMRLGFAINAFLEPDILIVDEVLAVGDAEFQRRCLERMSEVVTAGTTLVYVSHDLATVEAMCDRTLWLSDGSLREDGPTHTVLRRYRRAVETGQPAAIGSAATVHCRSAAMTGGATGLTTGAPASVQLDLELHEECKARLVVGISDGSPTPIFAVQDHRGLPAGRSLTQIDIGALPLPGGSYSLWFAIVGEHDRVLVPWHAASHLVVDGPLLEPLPTGIVRHVPVHVDAAWTTSELPS